MSVNALDAMEAVEAAIRSIGLGYDLTSDLRLQFCKRNSTDPRLIAIDDDQGRIIELCNGTSIPDVPKSIKCDKGERRRVGSDVLSFQQMSEQFNREQALAGQIPTGHFNAAFGFPGAWQKDAAYTKCLAFEGVSITLYNITFDKTQVVLRNHVKQAVPSSWDPAALARFIKKYGTHVIVGAKVGGTDMFYARQRYSSPVQPADVQKKLKDMADRLFINRAGLFNANDGKYSQKEKLMTDGSVVDWMESDFLSTFYTTMEVQEIIFIHRRKGGSGKESLTHTEWCQTVLSHPNVISMSFIPITSLLCGVNGSGFLTHAINLYLRCKVPIKKLHQFLEFQLSRKWAPTYGVLPLGLKRKPQDTATLQFSFMRPKLHIDTTPVDVGKKPVTGLRLCLEGKKSNYLAIHLQHLSSLPKTFQLEDDPNGYIPNATLERKYCKKFQLKNLSHVCTIPVCSDKGNSIVTGAHFEVGDGREKVLCLRLHFTKVTGARVRRSEWDGYIGLTKKSRLISTSSTTSSNLYPEAEEPPAPAPKPKLLRFVDTQEITRGPQDTPGYWVVSGARLFVENGKISLRVKYSLLTVIPPHEEG